MVEYFAISVLHYCRGLFGGLTFTPPSSLAGSNADLNKDAAKPQLTFSFGKPAADLKQSTSAPLLSEKDETTVVTDRSASERASPHPEDEECTADFKPVITLPDLVEVSFPNPYHLPPSVLILPRLYLPFPADHCRSNIRGGSVKIRISVGHSLAGVSQLCQAVSRLVYLNLEPRHPFLFPRL